MVTLNELYEIANKDNIKITRYSFEDLNGICMSVNDKDYIFLNTDLNETEEKCTLMEELAHSKVGILSNLPYATDYYNRLIRSKNENKALKYVVSKFIPKEEIDTCNDKYELIDKLEITEEFMDKILEFIRKEN